MTIYGYFVTYTDYNDSVIGTNHKDYGFVAADSRANAIAIVENMYEDEMLTIDEVGLTQISDEDDNPAILNHFQIEFFTNTMKQHGYDEEGN